MAEQAGAPRDNWSSETYTGKVASFTHLLTARVVALLDPQPTDRILDIGCGDGVLTSKLSSKCAHIHGVDASANMISTAQSVYRTPTSTYSVADCRYLPAAIPTLPTPFTKVFSNAALHWILRDPTTRLSTLRGAWEALAPGGAFVAELGGHGNVGEVHAALIAALVHRGVSPAAAREAGPWLYPTEAYMRELLVAAGFAVVLVETELRQTVLTSGEGGGLEGWVRLFADAFWGVLREEEREGAVREVVEVVEGVGRRENGEFTLNYIRLRFVAKKPE